MASASEKVSLSWHLRWLVWVGSKVEGEGLPQVDLHLHMKVWGRGDGPRCPPQNWQLIDPPASSIHKTYLFPPGHKNSHIRLLRRAGCLRIGTTLEAYRVLPFALYIGVYFKADVKQTLGDHFTKMSFDDFCICRSWKVDCVLFSLIVLQVLKVIIAYLFFENLFFYGKCPGGKMLIVLSHTRCYLNKLVVDRPCQGDSVKPCDCSLNF